jgi:hypothetical protein
MPTNIKVAVYTRGHADQQGRNSAQQQMRVCRAAAVKAGWIVLANVSERKKQLPTP